MSTINREQWLTLATSHLRAHFLAEAALTVPQNVRVSCGFPSKSALGTKSRRVGECWGDEASATKTFEVFVSPLLDDARAVAHTLAHELVHATVGIRAKHGAAFKRVALAIGLTGKMTATVPGPKFDAWWNTVGATLPPYPHGALSAMSRDKQKTRLVKVECGECAAEGEPYLVRMSAKTLERGAPHCPIHLRAMSQALPNGEGN